jgi:septum formation protein
MMKGLGLAFEVRPADVDETRRPDESPPAYVERLAREKAAAAAEPEALAIGCDTVVVHEGRIHEVMTGIAVAGYRDGELAVESAVDVTEVRMLPMTEEEIDDYVASGEPMDKAGSYALQEYGGVFVESIRGSAHTVVGMPVHLLPRLVARFGISLNALRAGS